MEDINPAKFWEQVKKFSTENPTIPITCRGVCKLLQLDTSTCRKLLNICRRQGKLSYNSGVYTIIPKVVKTPAKTPVTPVITKAKDTLLNVILDSVSLVIALILELVIMSISMWVIAPGILESLGLIAAGWVCVLYGLRAWLKGKTWFNRIVWFCFAMISIFFNVSFSLSVTSAQSAIVQVSTEDDFTLKSLQAQAQLYVEQIDTLSRQYDEAFRSTTVDMLLSQIEITRDKLNNTNQRIIDRLEELGRQGVVTKRAPITADSIFLAIPNAVRDKKIIQLICFGVLFIGLETSIIVAASKYRS